MESIINWQYIIQILVQKNCWHILVFLKLIFSLVFQIVVGRSLHPYLTVKKCALQAKHEPKAVALEAPLVTRRPRPKLPKFMPNGCVYRAVVFSMPKSNFSAERGTSNADISPVFSLLHACNVKSQKGQRISWLKLSRESPNIPSLIFHN